MFGDETKMVNLKVPVIFIIGDKLHCLCPKCNVRGDESGNPFIQCKKINMVRMMQLVKEKTGYSGQLQSIQRA
jgi:hypothetical protein